MVDTIRTEAQLLSAVFHEGQQAGAITPQDIRDLIVSMKTINPELITTLSAPSYKEGKIFYDFDHKALSYYNEDPDVTVNIGQETLLRCLNNTGGTLTDGNVVYISGADGETPEITKAISSANTPSILGVVTSLIENTTYGYVTVFGLVHGLDTSQYNPGDILYLSDTILGGLTNVAPTLPKETIIIATVINAQVDGHILVNVNRVNSSAQISAIVQLSQSTTLNLGVADTPEPITINTNDHIENILHDETVNNSELTIAHAGLYIFTAGLQITHVGGGSSTITAWIQHDTGSGFTNVSNSAVKQDLSNNDTRVLQLVYLRRFAVNDKIRFMWNTTNLSGELSAVAATGDIPAIPAVIVMGTKVGVA